MKKKILIYIYLLYTLKICKNYYLKNNHKIRGEDLRHLEKYNRNLGYFVNKIEFKDVVNKIFYLNRLTEILENKKSTIRLIANEDKFIYDNKWIPNNYQAV